MEHKDIIQQELMEIAPALAPISRRMPFSVPEGYFEELPLSVLGNIAPRQAKMAVPEGYFDNLPALLLQKAKAAAAEEVSNEAIYPLLESIAGKMPFEAPQGYFDGFPAIMLEKVQHLQTASDEEEPVYPVLATISKKMPFSVPAGYFEQLEMAIPQQEASVVEAPVVPITRPLRRVAGWAVAASILAVVSLFGYRFFTGNSEVNHGELVQNNGRQLDSTVTAELANALAELEDSNLDRELDNYGINAEKTALYYLNTVNFEKALQTLSEEEIRKNLEAQGYYHKKS